MKTAPFLTFGVVCGIVFLTGCQRRATGSISGDVYLLMQNGEGRKHVKRRGDFLGSPAGTAPLRDRRPNAQAAHKQTVSL
jgi:hypothetical protein